jgi:hypothetical protein
VRTLEDCRKYLARMPAAIQGQGGNDATWNAMLAIAGFSLAEADAWTAACEFNMRCLPPWSEEDLSRKLGGAHRARLAGRFANGNRGTFAPMPKPKPTGPIAPAELPSPEPMPGASISAAETLLHLFKPGELVRLVRGAAEKDGKWHPAGLGDFMSAAALADLIANGILNENLKAGAWLGINPQKDATGTAAGVASFRFMLMEGDKLPREQQLACIRKTGLPVSAVVDSAGKSLHAWVRLDADSPEEWHRRAELVRRVALPLGFDEATMKQPGQMTRLPGAIRGGKPQRVVALDMGAACFADWEAANRAPQGADEAWPFKCLGFDETRFWFLPLDTMRPVSMQAGDLTSKGKLLGIHTDGGWWSSVFPDKDAKGADYSRAGTVLRERCVAAGYWDAAKQADTLRGRGLWVDGGSVVFNSGVAGRLLVDGTDAPAGWRSPTCRTYLSGGTLELADAPLTDDEAMAFVRLLSVQTGSEAAATICAGWTFNAVSVGTVSMRAHLYLTGEKGAGKSHTLKLIEAACGPFIVKAAAGTTEAGLRQEMGGANDALAFSYDEAEGDTERGRERLQGILELLRLGGEGDGQVVRKGTPGGSSRAYKLRTAGLFASIHSVLSRDRDRSRFAVVDIKTRTGADEATRNREAAMLAARTTELPGFAGKMARRAVCLAHVRIANAATIKAALTTKMGDERARKLWAELLAGAEAMRHSRRLTDDEAAQIAADFDPAPFTGEQDDEAGALLKRLLTSAIDDGDGRRRTVGELVVKVSHGESESKAMVAALARVGMLWDHGVGMRFAVNSTGLLALVKDEPWLGDGQRVKRTLTQLHGALYKPSMRVGINKGAAVVVPSQIVAQHLEGLNMRDPY